MAYSTGILNNQIKVLNRTEAKTSAFGSGSGGYTWTTAATLWAAVDWSRGTKAMRNGTLDAYDVIMVRCRYNSALTRNSRIEYDNRLYNIDSYHADKHANTIQCTCTEITGMT